MSGGRAAITLVAAVIVSSTVAISQPVLRGRIVVWSNDVTGHSIDTATDGLEGMPALFSSTTV